jgi:hypothetical protein
VVVVTGVIKNANGLKFAFAGVVDSSGVSVGKMAWRGKTDGRVQKIVWMIIQVSCPRLFAAFSSMFS